MPLAMLIGAITAASGTGAATSNSRVPWKRCCSSEPAEPIRTIDHISITAAPSEALRSSFGSVSAPSK